MDPQKQSSFRTCTPPAARSKPPVLVPHAHEVGVVNNGPFIKKIHCKEIKKVKNTHEVGVVNTVY